MEPWVTNERVKNEPPIELSTIRWCSKSSVQAPAANLVAHEHPQASEWGRKAFLRRIIHLILRAIWITRWICYYFRSCNPSMMRLRSLNIPVASRRKSKIRKAKTTSLKASQSNRFWIRIFQMSSTLAICQLSRSNSRLSWASLCAWLVKLRS